MAIWMIASDLDGTLLDSGCRISAETADAVKMAQRAGIRFMAATGRAWSTAHSIFQETGIEADYILLNGAEFRLSSGEVIYQETIQRNIAEKLVDYLLAMGADFEINTAQGDFSTNTKVCQTASEMRDLSHFWSVDPKILKVFSFSDERTIVENMREHLKGWQGISVTSSAGWNIEITAAAAQKGKMLKRAADFYQVPAEEVMVFGDGENDESMFGEFCHSCAVGNAIPMIRSMAEKVIDSNDKNGVAKEINKILGGKQNGII